MIQIHVTADTIVLESRDWFIVIPNIVITVPADGLQKFDARNQ